MNKDEVLREVIVLNKARELGVSALYLSADTAEGFYPRLGWQVLERLESHGVRDVLLMSKRLL